VNEDEMDEPERIWNALVAAARRVPKEPLPALDVDRVLQAAGTSKKVRPSSTSNRDERIISWAALFALAASLLLTFTYWSDVAAAWSPQPAIFELPLNLEPLP
jgi:hypothetical protein